MRTEDEIRVNPRPRDGVLRLLEDAPSYRRHTHGERRWSVAGFVYHGDSPEQIERELGPR